MRMFLGNSTIKRAGLLLLVMANSILLGQDSGDGFGNTPTNPDPQLYVRHIDIYSFDNGEPYEKDTQRVGPVDTTSLDCPMCRKKESSPTTGGFGVVVVNASWKIEIPDVGTFSGGDPAKTIDLSKTIQCAGCSNTETPLYKYNSTTTMAVPYAKKKTARFLNADGSLYVDVPYSYVLPNEKTASYSIPDVEFGSTDDLGCPSPQCAPCN